MLCYNHGSQMAGGKVPDRGLISEWKDCRMQRNAAGAENSSTIYKKLGMCGQQGAKYRTLSLKGPVVLAF